MSSNTSDPNAFGSATTCLCRHFPNPCTNCNNIDFEKKQCETFVFNADNPYPHLSISTDTDWEPETHCPAYDDLDAKVMEKHRLLHHSAVQAINDNDIETFKFCLQSGLNVNNEWLVGKEEEDNCWVGGAWSYLHHTSQDKRYDFMKLLIDHGANVNCIDYEGETPLFLMVATDKELDFVGCNILIDAGADPDFNNFKGKTTQRKVLDLINNNSKELKRLHKYGLAFEVFTLFLENGGDLSMMLELAQSEYCDPRLYSMFLKAGADPYLISEEGHNVLYYLEKNNCHCDNMIKSIRLLNKATELKLEKSDINLQHCTECSVCCSGNKTNFCQTQCCHQHLHVGCLRKWLKSRSNTNQSCPFCRATVKKVDLVTIKPVFNPGNLSKRTSERGLIFSYLFETKVNENGGIMYKIQ